MKLTGLELRRIRMPLVAPFRTSFGTETSRDILLLRAVTGDAEGWGECVAMGDPLYSSEYVDAAADVLRRFLVPALFAHPRLDAVAVGPALHRFKGHRMAKAALETAVLDAELRAQGRPLSRELGAVHDRVPCGVSVGIMDSIGELLDEEDLLGHARLARQVRTPICLDESITSARAAADAIALGACEIVNIKPGRVGGYLESRRIHDVCAAHGVPVWAGGMLETGIGRAANVALAALPGFTLPGDTSASDRYYRTDITAPFVLDDGHLAVPTGPGIGVEPIPAMLDEVTTATEWLTP